GGNDMRVVAAVNTAEAALEVLRSVQVDAILLDLEMPGMGGLKALPRLLAKAPRARILVVSSLTIDGAEQTLAALSLGATAALPKPDALSFSDGYRDMLLDRIRALGPAKGTLAAPAPVPAITARPAIKPARALGIGASTGGIHALVRF